MNDHERKIFDSVAIAYQTGGQIPALRTVLDNAADIKKIKDKYELTWIDLTKLCGMPESYHSEINRFVRAVTEVADSYENSTRNIDRKYEWERKMYDQDDDLYPLNERKSGREIKTIYGIAIAVAACLGFILGLVAAVLMR